MSKPTDNIIVRHGKFASQSSDMKTGQNVSNEQSIIVRHGKFASQSSDMETEVLNTRMQSHAESKLPGGLRDQFGSHHHSLESRRNAASNKSSQFSTKFINIPEHIFQKTRSAHPVKASLPPLMKHTRRHLFIGEGGWRAIVASLV